MSIFKIAVVLATILFSGCALLEPLPPKVIETTKIVYPNIPEFKAPPKHDLVNLKFDWPRDLAVYTIKNTKKCRLKFKQLYPIEHVESFRLQIDSYSAFELEKFPKFYSSCAINPIDLDSNLYIGLTELNYKDLVTNNATLLQREKQWRFLLDRINAMIRSWREPKKVLK